jgi:glutaminase
MYDYAGEWVYRVGLPAKSGVGGGLLAVLPGQLAIAVWSPPLDERGNSVRGVAACEALSDELALHFLRAPRPTLTAVQSRLSLRELASKRLRVAAEEAVLAEHGDEAVVLVLQGDLAFAGVEAVLRRVVREASSVAHVVLDFARATDVDPPSARLLLELDETLAERGRRLLFVGLAAHPRLLRQLEEASTRGTTRRPLVFDELDAALEACERAILAAHGVFERDGGELPFAQHDLLRGLDGAQLELLGGLLERRRYAAHEIVVDEGDPSDELFLLVQGALSVLSHRRDGAVRRLATLSPGMAFGETSLVEGGTRTATVRADCTSTCFVLKRASFESLGAASPETKIRLLESLLRSSTRSVGRLSRELASVRRS